MEKTLEILVAAQELFGKYGFAKTTMTDIAERLEISKASLYYYYKDKESVYLAVIGKEQDQFINMLHHFILQNDDPENILYQYVQIRIKYFSEMLNLNRARFDDFKGLQKVAGPSWKQFRDKEKVEIKFILEKGIEKGIFEIGNIDETSLVYLDAFKGLVFYYLRHKDLNFLEELDYQTLEKQLNLFTTIFIKGIKK